MKRLLIILLLCSLISKLFAPGAGRVSYILVSEPIRPYKQLIYAIGKVECNLDTLAYNPAEDAVGYFQVRPIRLQDFNERTGKLYILSDMYDYDKALEVFLYYCQGDYETVARVWNGGPQGMKKKSTKKYWSRVKIYI